MDEELRSMLTVIIKEIRYVKDDVQELKEGVKVLKEDVSVLKEDVKELKEDIVAENHINLIDKMNESIRASDKTLMYEIAVDTLKTRVNRLEKEMDKIKKSKRVTV